MDEMWVLDVDLYRDVGSNLTGKEIINNLLSYV